MKKGRALAGAGAITITAVAGALAIGGSLGLVNLTEGPAKTGALSPADPIQVKAEPEPTPIIETVIVDVPAPRQAAPPAAAGVTQPVIAPTVDPPPSPSSADGNGSFYEDEAEEEDSHSDEDDPYETEDHANEDEHADSDD
jgi:hypothetical protein